MPWAAIKPGPIDRQGAELAARGVSLATDQLLRANLGCCPVGPTVGVVALLGELGQGVGS